MSCTLNTETNGEKSLLFNKLLEVVKSPGMSQEEIEDNAKKEYAYLTGTTKNSAMLKMFGNYKTAYASNYEEEFQDFVDRVDDNGEPRLFFQNELNKYYFKDKYGEKVQFPFGRTGLHSSRLFTIAEIKAFTNSLANEYYANNAEFDIDTFTINNSKDIENLDEFIKGYISRVSARLLESGNTKNMALGHKLLISSENSKEWAQEVKDYFASMKININDQVVSVVEEETLQRGERFDIASFEVSSKNNINNNIKLYLSQFRSTETNMFGEFVFVPFDDIFSTLNKSLANTVEVGEENEYNLYLAKIKDLAKIKPYFEEVYEDLRHKSTDFQSQFVSAFRLHKNNFLGSEAVITKNLRTKETTLSYIVRNLSEVGSRKNNIVLRG